MSSCKEALTSRRSVYALNNRLPLSEEEVVRVITETCELVPDAFNQHSQRVVVVLGTAHHLLWDAIYRVFDGKVAPEKIESFKAGAGTALFFYDKGVVSRSEERYPLFAAHFPTWTQQANGMLQFAVWTELASKGVGASLQHYNPVIDDAIRELYDLPESYVLTAQMPFGGIAQSPAPKEKEDISRRVRVVR